MTTAIRTLQEEDTVGQQVNPSEDESVSNISNGYMEDFVKISKKEFYRLNKKSSADMKKGNVFKKIGGKLVDWTCDKLSMYHSDTSMYSTEEEECFGRRKRKIVDDERIAGKVSRVKNVDNEEMSKMQKQRIVPVDTQDIEPGSEKAKNLELTDTSDE